MVKMGLKGLLLAGMLSYMPNLEARDFKEGNSVVQKSGIYWTKEGNYWTKRDQDSWFMDKTKDRPKFRSYLSSELNKGAKLIEKNHNSKGKEFVNNFRSKLPYISLEKSGNDKIKIDGKIKGEQEVELYVKGLTSIGMNLESIAGIAKDNKIDSTEMQLIINHAFLNRNQEFSYMQKEMAHFANDRINKSKLPQVAKNYLGLYSLYPKKVHEFFAASNKLLENIENNLTSIVNEPTYIRSNFNSEKAKVTDRKYRNIKNKEIEQSAKSIAQNFNALDKDSKTMMRHIARDYRARTNDTLKIMSPNATIFITGDNYKILIDKPKESKLTLIQSN